MAETYQGLQHENEYESKLSKGRPVLGKENKVNKKTESRRNNINTVAILIPAPRAFLFTLFLYCYLAISKKRGDLFHKNLVFEQKKKARTTTV